MARISWEEATWSQILAEGVRYCQLAAAHEDDGAFNVVHDLQRKRIIRTPQPGTAVTTILLTAAKAAKYNNRTGRVVEPTEGPAVKPGRAAVLLKNVTSALSFKLMNLRVDS